MLCLFFLNVKSPRITRLSKVRVYMQAFNAHFGVGVIKERKLVAPLFLYAKLDYKLTRCMASAWRCDNKNFIRDDASRGTLFFFSFFSLFRGSRVLVQIWILPLRVLVFFFFLFWVSYSKFQLDLWSYA